MKNVLVIWVWRQWKEHVKALINLRGKKIKNIYIYDVDVDWIKSFAIGIVPKKCVKLEYGYVWKLV